MQFYERETVSDRNFKIKVLQRWARSLFGRFWILKSDMWIFFWEILSFNHNQVKLELGISLYFTIQYIHAFNPLILIKKKSVLQVQKMINSTFTAYTALNHVHVFWNCLHFWTSLLENNMIFVHMWWKWRYQMSYEFSFHEDRPRNYRDMSLKPRVKNSAFR